MNALRRAIRWTLYAVIAIVAVVLIGATWLHTSWGHSTIRQMAISRSAAWIDGELSIGSVSGSVFHAITFRDVAIKQHGVPVLTVPEIRADYSVVTMIASRSVALDKLTLDRPQLQVVQDANGWHVLGLATRKQTGGHAPRIAMHDVVASGASVDIRPSGGTTRRITDLAFETTLLYDSTGLKMEIARLTGRDPDTRVAIKQLQTSLVLAKGNLTFDQIDVATDESHVTGSVLIKNEATRVVELHLNGDRVSLPEIGKYVSALRVMKVTPAVSVTANGPLDAIAANYVLTSSAGDARGLVHVNALAPAKTVTGDMDSRAIDIGAMFGNPAWASRFTGHTKFTLTWPPHSSAWPIINFDTNLADARAFGYQAGKVTARGVYRDDVVSFAGNLSAYGASSTVSGKYDVTRRTFAGSGHAANVDLRLLPAQWQAPAYASTLAGDYTVTIAPNLWDATMTFAPSVLEGATIAGGMVAHVHLADGFIQYSARGHATNLDPQRMTRVWPVLPDAVRNLDGRLNGDFTADAAGSTSNFATHEGTFTISFGDSIFEGVHFDQLIGDVTLSESQLTANAHGSARGNMDRFLSGPPRDINLNGMFEAHAHIADLNAPFRFENLDGSLLASLTGSSALGVDVDRADIDGDVNNGVATVRKFDIAGPHLHATADGAVALGSQGTSNLKYKVEAEDFSVLGKYRPEGLEGSGSLEGTLTGPTSARSFSGTLNGRELQYGAFTALSLTTKYKADVPGTDFAAAHVTADSDATFATIRGLKVDHVTAKTGYENKSLDVDATFEQGTRHASVAGSLVVHPDHHEVHVRTLQLASGDATWTLPAGTEAKLQYTPTRISVEDLDLMQGDERVSANGTFWLSAEDKTPVASDLTVRADRVRVEHLMSLFLGPNITGELDGTAHATGTLQDPHVVFDGTVGQGTVNTVPFDAVNGHADWTRERLTLDAELVAATDSHLKVTGTMPFGSAATPDAAHDTRAMDLHVDGNIANVGLLAPFITHVDKLSGTGAIALHIAGTRNAPAIDGTVGLSNVSFLVTPTGVVYRNLNAALRFAEQRMFVDNLRLEDDDGHVLTAAGSLDVLEGATSRAVDVHATATSIHLLHNQLGEIMLDANLSAAGDITAPKITGVLDVERARLELDRILAELNISPYDPVEALTAPPPPQTEEKKPIPPPLPFMQGMSLSVDVQMPQNVIVRGRNIRVGPGAAGLGDLNATVGGALHLDKALGQSTTILGTVDVVRGSYSFQGRRFDITRGSEVRFTGLLPIDPMLSLTAEREITGVTAQVRVTGTLRQPELTLSSSPPLDEGDVLSLIMFNRSVNRLGDAEKVSLAETAGALAAGSITSPITASVARALDLDIFDITPTDVSGGGATVTVGRQISERLFVGFKQAFGADETSRLTFEYQLTQFLRIVSSVGQGATTSQLKSRAEAAGIDLIFIIK